MTQDPMSLDKLPGYLKSLKEKGEMGGSVIVDMGQIVPEKRSWPKRLAFSMMVFLALGTVGVATYKFAATEQLTVVVDVDPSAISQIVSDSGGQILSVTRREGSTYEVKASTRQGRHAFLEWLRKSTGVKKANLE